MISEIQVFHRLLFSNVSVSKSSKVFSRTDVNRMCINRSTYIISVRVVNTIIDLEVVELPVAPTTGRYRLLKHLIG